MRFLKRIFYPLFYTSLLFSTACQKDRKAKPEVQFLTPTINRSLSYGDTLQIELSSNEVVEKLKLELLDGNTPVPLDYRILGEQQEVYRVQLIHNDRYVKSGQYTLRATVSAGDQRAFDFLKLQLEELPGRQTALLALTSSNLWLRDSALQVTTLAYPGYQQLEFNSFQQQSWLMQESGELLAIKWGASQEYFSWSAPSSVEQSIFDLFSYRDRSFILHDPAELKAFDQMGQVVLSAPLPKGLQPRVGVSTEAGTLIAAKLTSKSIYRLLYNQLAGQAVSFQQDLPAEVIAMSGAGPASFCVLAEKDGNTELYKLSIENRTFNKIGEIEGEKPVAIAELTNGRCVFATDRQVYLFDPANFPLLIDLYNFAVSDLDYDPYGGYLYMASGSAIFRAQPGQEPMMVWSLPQSIQQIELAFNK